MLTINVKEYVPPVLGAGVPLKLAVPFPLFLNVTPAGNVPVAIRNGVGVPVAVTVKLPATPTVKRVVLALVIAGAWFIRFTVRVKV